MEQHRKQVAIKSSTRIQAVIYTADRQNLQWYSRESIWLGCKAENDYFPQDLELVIGDKIPDFISFLEENLTGKEDFKQAIDFVNKNLCY